MPAKTYVFDVNSVKDEVAAGGPATAVIMNHLALNWRWPTGQGPEEPRVRTFDQLRYVTRGEAVWHVDGKPFTVKEGQALYVPAHLACEEVQSPDEVVDILGGTPWERVHLAEHQIDGEYRDWVRDNPPVEAVP